MLSKRAINLNDSITIAISSKAKELLAKGEDIISLSTGEPDFNTPEVVKQAAIASINANYSRYTPVAGENALLRAIATKLLRDNNLSFDLDEICASTGAKQCLFNTIMCLVEKGDEVIIPVPFWVSYPEIVGFAGGKSVFVQPNEDFKLTPAALKAAITPKSKLLILNLPSNPSGTSYTKSELEDLWAVLKDTNILVIADEIYEKLLFDDNTFTSFASLNEDSKLRTITINGLSKCAAMPGWRFGYMASKIKELNQAVRKLQSQSTSNLCSIVQYAAIPALLGQSDDYVEYMRQNYIKRRKLALDILSSSKKLRVKSCQGAFYLFINHEKVMKSSLDFCKKLLEEEGVACVPGVGFGMEGYFRISFATKDELLEAGCKKILRFCK